MDNRSREERGPINSRSGTKIVKRGGDGVTGWSVITPTRTQCKAGAKPKAKSSRTSAARRLKYQHCIIFSEYVLCLVPPPSNHLPPARTYLVSQKVAKELIVIVRIKYWFDLRKEQFMFLPRDGEDGSCSLVSKSLVNRLSLPRHSSDFSSDILE